MKYTLNRFKVGLNSTDLVDGRHNDLHDPHVVHSPHSTRRHRRNIPNERRDCRSRLHNRLTTYTCHSLKHTRRLWRCSSQTWSCRIGRGTRCWRGHSRWKQNMTHQSLHTARLSGQGLSVDHCGGLFLDPCGGLGDIKRRR